VTNGDFEAGFTGWVQWEILDGFWDAQWIQSNDCDILISSPCPFSGSTSHAQKKGNDVNNAFGGLYQVLSVEPGVRYHVSGRWSGGAEGNDDGFAFWEVVIYDGAVDETVIQNAPGVSDFLVAKEEISNLPNGVTFQYDWQPFSGEFTAQSSQVTLALKAGTAFNAFSASYHDEISVIPLPSIPTAGAIGLTALAALLSLLGLMILRR
jgi:hypothetical protein